MPKPAVLLYDPANSPWVLKFKQFCAVQGLRLRPVEADSPDRTVGALAQGLAPAGEAPAVPAISEPMLVFCSVTETQLDRCLAALRKAGAPRSVLKAVLTADNAGWTLSALYEELCKERLAMSQPDQAPEHSSQT